MDECVAPPKEKPMEIEVLIGQVREALGALPDARKGGNNQRYSMEDAALSAFGVFFTQSPSFLDYAQRMQKERGSNNASTLFGVHEIPSMQQVRNVLDGVEAKHLDGLFMDIAESMHKQGQLQTHRMFNGGIAIALDGTQYFCSTAIGCAHCSKKKLADGQECNFHVVVTPVVVAAGQQDVFALAPSYVMPQDGNEKQDCELAASGRWLQKWGHRLKDWKPTYLGDDLYCHEPFCRRVLAEEGDFLFVCLPNSHATLYEWVADFERTGTLNSVVHTRWTGKERVYDTYRFMDHMPLRNADDTLYVNWCELTTTNAQGKVLYRNAWATSHTITAHNVVELVETARSRWKIENENNNTLKTKGYHFEHNFGHGKQHLSSILASLILLAFLLHTVLDRMDQRYRTLRQQLPSRRTFFEHLRALLQYVLFESWQELFDLMLEALKPAAPKRKAPPATG